MYILFLSFLAFGRGHTLDIAAWDPDLDYQLFVDFDGDVASGYGAGWDYVVRILRSEEAICETTPVSDDVSSVRRFRDRTQRTSKGVCDGGWGRRVAGVRWSSSMGRLLVSLPWRVGRVQVECYRDGTRVACPSQ